MPAKPLPRTRAAAAAQRGEVQTSSSLTHMKSKNKDNQQLGERHSSENIASTCIKGPVAYVEVGVGQTINTGNFNSLRLDVRVTIPCGVDEIESTYQFASETAAHYINRERDAWMTEGAN